MSKPITATVQKTYRLNPELAAAVRRASGKVKLSENDFVAHALQHACGEPRRTGKPTKAKTAAHAR